MDIVGLIVVSSQGFVMFRYIHSGVWVFDYFFLSFCEIVVLWYHS